MSFEAAVDFFILDRASVFCKAKLNRSRTHPRIYMAKKANNAISKTYQTVALKLPVEKCNVSPASEQSTHLIHELQVGEEGDVLGPLHGAEQQPGRQLADVLDAHQVVPLHALGPIARRGVGLGAQQQGNETG